MTGNPRWALLLAALLAVAGCSTVPSSSSTVQITDAPSRPSESVGIEPLPYDPRDPRRSHPLLPVKMSEEATEAVRRTVSEGEDITVRVVPVIMGFTEQTSLEDVFKFNLQPRIVAYETEVETA